MIKVLFVAFLLSVLSLVLIIVLPVGVSDQGSKVGPSPYRAQIDELYAETSKGLPPDAPQWKKLEELRRKNNEWFETDGQLTVQGESLSLFDVLKVKSSKISLLLMIVWGVGFYFILKVLGNYFSLFILVFPILLFIFNIISITALAVISVAVLSVYFTTFIRKIGYHFSSN